MRRPLSVEAVLLVCAACGGPTDEQFRSRAGHPSSASEPSALHATAVSASENDLDWAPDPKPVTGYQVYRSVGPSAAYDPVASLPAAATAYADGGLPASSPYCYRVRSWRTSRNGTSYSPFLGPACATTFAAPPPAPSRLASPSGVAAVPVRDDFFRPDDSIIQVTWFDNSANEGQFRIEEASSVSGPWTQSMIVPANSTSAVRLGVREQRICFRITAVSSSATSDPSLPACTVAPANPTGLAARTVDGRIGLTWADNSAFEDGYEVWRADPTGTWSELATLPANATGYTDGNLSADQTYLYRVQAVRDGGGSDYSNLAAGVLATAVPAAPAGLVAMYWADMWGGWLYFDVFWTDGSDNETGFRIETSDDGIAGWMPVSIPLPGQSYVHEQLDLFLFVGGFFDACYRVVAFNSLGDSLPSNVFCTGWGGAPQDLVATAVDRQTIDLSWTSVARSASGYDIYRVTSGADWEIVASLPPDATSHRDTGLAAGTDYQYIVTVKYPLNDQYDFYNQAWSSVATAP